jgi:transposase
MEESSFKLYERLLRLGPEWEVIDIQVNDKCDEIHITVKYKLNYWADRTTGEMYPIYDHRMERVWRHLDSMEHATFIHCKLPRIQTPDGKVHTIEVEWSESGVSHTKKFENKSISTLQATHCQKTAADLMQISDDKMCGIMHRSVLRGLQRRDLSHITQISLDEKSYRKGHQYITVLSDSRTGTVLDIAKDRTEKAADTLLKSTLNPDRLTCIRTACCDMWEAFANALKKTVRMPNWYTTSFTLSNT